MSGLTVDLIAVCFLVVLVVLAGVMRALLALSAPGQVQDCTRYEWHDGPCNGWPCRTALIRLELARLDLRVMPGLVADLLTVRNQRELLQAQRYAVASERARLRRRHRRTFTVAVDGTTTLTLPHWQGGIVDGREFGDLRTVSLHQRP